MPKLVQFVYQKLLGKDLQRVRRESQEFLASDEAQGPDLRVIVVLLAATACLVFQSYIGQPSGAPWVARALRWVGLASWGDGLLRLLDDPHTRELTRMVYWAAARAISYVIVPGVCIKLVIGDSLLDYGLRVRGMLGSVWIYLVMAAIMIPPVLAFSTTESFQETYPFYNLAADEPLWPKFLIAEFCYVLQFFALEFFFRGFLVHGLRRRFGVYSVLVMMVPYCMIHFQKPLPEACGAIGAGIVLGLLSLKGRSIWWGAVLHVLVALTMDFASLWQRGLI
ncbi:MAG: CPBP family intramembrane metalloprotease [Planctomycetes bacterium]|nr:CPBP family intramembrane metalloprotease [Planctomycetota bacterium]